jgi:hypothetical protein
MLAAAEQHCCAFCSAITVDTRGVAPSRFAHARADALGAVTASFH